MNDETWKISPFFTFRITKIYRQYKARMKRREATLLFDVALTYQHVRVKKEDNI